MPLISLSCCIFPAIYVLKFLACFTFSHASLCNKIDNDSLLSFADGISSPSPLNWSVSVDCCRWEGVSCNEDHRVSHLWLPSRQLQGEISPSLANLSYLSCLNLSNNQLSGPLPDIFFKSLNRLQIIDLSYNGLNGQLSDSDKLPSTIKSVNISSNEFDGEIQFAFLEGSRFLVGLNVSNNNFTGFAPAFICSISPFLKFLDFSFNHFVGRIPKGFGECLNLLTLRASFNSLSWPLPDDIYKISTLRDLSMAANSLSGGLDHRVADLLELRILSLYGNELTGTIPDNIGRLNKLESLLLHINRLNGTIPLSLKNCYLLKILNLRVNNLGGELCTFDFSSLVRLRTIDLGDNFFTGSLPTTIFSCKNLVNIRFSNNSLQGEIMPDFQALESLSFLSLSRNNFTNITQAITVLKGCRKLGALVLSKNFFGESIQIRNGSSSGDDGFKELRSLALGGCGFRGELPGWLRKLKKLEVLDISYNQITGNIPGWISELPNLFYLDMSSNFLSGSIPSELFRLQRLTSDNKGTFLQLNQSHLELPIFVSPNNVSMFQYNLLSHLPVALYLNSNNLSGHLPTDIGMLSLIQVLNLRNNRFSGNIPESISSITTLEKLDLSENGLSGKIPGSLKNLHFLSSFSVANNDLEGEVPTGGQFHTFTASSFEGNPRLCGQILLRPCSNIKVSNDDEHDSSTQGNESKHKIIVYGIFGFSFVVSFFVTLYYSLGSFSTSCARLIVSRLQVKSR